MISKVSNITKVTSHLSQTSHTFEPPVTATTPPLHNGSRSHWGRKLTNFRPSPLGCLKPTNISFPLLAVLFCTRHNQHLIIVSFSCFRLRKNSDRPLPRLVDILAQIMSVWSSRKLAARTSWFKGRRCWAQKLRITEDRFARDARCKYACFNARPIASTTVCTGWKVYHALGCSSTIRADCSTRKKMFFFLFLFSFFFLKKTCIDFIIYSHKLYTMA